MSPSFYQSNCWCHAINELILSGRGLLLEPHSLIHRPIEDLNKKLSRATFKLILKVDGWGMSCEIGLRWISLDLVDYKPTSVQAMAWCRQATNHISEPLLTQMSHHTASRRNNELISPFREIFSIPINQIFSIPFIFDRSSTAKRRQLSNIHVITVTSELVLWRLKSLASRLFAQPFVHVQIK